MFAPDDYWTLGLYLEDSGEDEDVGDPCCLLYREPYGQDHEYDCSRAIAYRREQRA